MSALTRLQNSLALQIAGDKAVFDKFSDKTKKVFAATSVAVILAAANNSAYAAGCGNSYAGPAIGGIAGALLAGQAGGGNGKTALAAGGAIVGTIVGGRLSEDCDNGRDNSRELAMVEARRAELLRQQRMQEEVLREEARRQAYEREQAYQREAERRRMEDERQRQSQYRESCTTSEPSITGQVIGGIAGGLLGRNVGGGNGQRAAVAAGAITGVLVGGRLSEKTTCRPDSLPNQTSRYSGPVPTVSLSYDEKQKLDDLVVRTMRTKIEWEASVQRAVKFIQTNSRQRVAHAGTGTPFDDETALRQVFVNSRNLLAGAVKAIGNLHGQPRDVSEYVPTLAALMSTPTEGAISAKALFNQELELRRDPAYERFYQSAAAEVPAATADLRKNARITL